MGEMCDFEAEYYPERWTERTAMKGKKKVVLTLSIPQWRKFRAIGGLPALKKLMAEAPTPQTAKPEPIDLLARIHAAELDAARYRWLRHGDNDEDIIAYADDADPFSWLPRNKELDAAIDAAMKETP